jgi:hypothetical protein
VSQLRIVVVCAQRMALVLVSLATVFADPGASSEHIDPSGAFAFRTPSHWTVSSALPDVTEVEGDGMVVRLLSRAGDNGFDSLHVSCMQNRLGDAMAADPRIEYEYDFLQAEVGDRRLLDSAFRTRYDEPVRGHKEWRQRNVTFVSPKGSLCIIAFCPAKVWKGSEKARVMLDGVVRSVSTR